MLNLSRRSRRGGDDVGLFGISIYDKKLTPDIKNLGKSGNADYSYGSGLTEEGLGGLRSLDSTYSSRLNDPLGSVGRGIFTRARAGLQDDFSRAVNSGDAHAAQLARQSGGALTPEQVAALDAENRRGASEGLFTGTGKVADAEATATLTEQGKLFDRLEGIRKTIVGVGQDEKNRGLQSILQALTFRYNKDAQKRSILSSFANSIVGAAAGGAASGAGGAAAPVGGNNPWGIH